MFQSRSRGVLSAMALATSLGLSGCHGRPHNANSPGTDPARESRPRSSQYKLLCSITINQGPHVLATFTFRPSLSGPYCEAETTFIVPEARDTYQVEFDCLKWPDVIDLRLTNRSTGNSAETRAQAPQDLYAVLGEGNRLAVVLCKFVP